jgi:hypothetical protein
LNFLNPLSGRKSSEEPEESSQDESASCDEKQTTDVSEFGESGAPEVLSQRGHAVRHTRFHLVYINRRVVHFSQMAAEQQQQPLSPFTPTRPPQIVISSSTTSGLISEPTGPISPFKGSTAFESPQLDVPSQSPAEKLETVKQYLRDRADQPLHHVEYVGLVSLLKDSLQGL